MPSVRLPFQVRERVRWSDCDPLGVMYYGAYPRFFDIAEHEMLRSLGLPYDVLRVERKVWLPRRAVQMEFGQPAAMDEELEIGIGVANIGTTSVTYRLEAVRASDAAPRAAATITVVCVDKATVEKRPLPPWFRDALERMRIGEAPAGT